MSTVVRALLARYPRTVDFSRATTVTAAYVGLVAAFFCTREDWPFVDALYFAMVTMSTVGYGDLHPSDDTLSQMMTVLFILVGVVFVFGEISRCVSHVTDPALAYLRGVLERRFPQRAVDIDGDGLADYKVPRGPLVYYAKNLMPAVSIFLLMQLLWALLFRYVEEWSFRAAWYHCMVTATTVGYGDVAIESDTGKLLATCHIFVSVTLLSSLLSDCLSVRSNREKLLRRSEQLQRRLDPELIASLDQDGRGVDKTEFVVGMIVALGMLEKEDVAPFLKQFDQIDVDGSGRLTHDDLEQAAHAVAAKRRQLTQRQLTRSAAGSGDRPRLLARQATRSAAEARKRERTVGGGRDGGGRGHGGSGAGGNCRAAVAPLPAAKRIPAPLTAEEERELEGLHAALGGHTTPPHQQQEPQVRGVAVARRLGSTAGPDRIAAPDASRLFQNV